MISPASSGRTPVGISRSSGILNLPDLVETVALVCGSSATGLDVQLVDADVVLVRNAEDAAAEPVPETDAYLVVPGGLDLMQELLRDGRIAKASRILWSFGLPVTESLMALEALELPAGMVVTGFSGHAHHAILLCAVREDATHDGESFRMGLKAARLESGWSDAHGDLEARAAEQRLVRELRTKHLSLLTSLGPVGRLNPGAASAGGPETDVAGLQDELTALRRNYASLERKYNALAQSKLGRLTLKLWDRKRYSAPGVHDATRSNA
jgi:hypothetical protein